MKKINIKKDANKITEYLNLVIFFIIIKKKKKKKNKTKNYILGKKDKKVEYFPNKLFFF